MMNWDEIKAHYVKIFTEVYTKNELKSIVNFYKSPAGQSMLKKQPLFEEKAMMIIQFNMQRIMPELQKIVHEFLQSEVKRAFGKKNHSLWKQAAHLSTSSYILYHFE
ncbi:MAG: DUF2059 domain-containing protein [Desulfobacterales bacterium]|nr:DUF2059 domain-containing protein [Desulfobacterales bacterium]